MVKRKMSNFLLKRASSWTAQVALKKAKAVVVGLGGVGSTVALELTVSGVGHVHCVDRDVVSLSDLNRQTLYTQQDLDRPKVDATMLRLRERNSSVQVTGERRKIENMEAGAEIVADFDLVVLAADDPPTIRSWTNRACFGSGTPWGVGRVRRPTPDRRGFTGRGPVRATTARDRRT